MTFLRRTFPSGTRDILQSEMNQQIFKNKNVLYYLIFYYNIIKKHEAKKRSLSTQKSWVIVFSSILKGGNS